MNYSNAPALVAIYVDAELSIALQLVTQKRRLADAELKKLSPEQALPKVARELLRNAACAEADAIVARA